MTYESGTHSDNVLQLLLDILWIVLANKYWKIVIWDIVQLTTWYIMIYDISIKRCWVHSNNINIGHMHMPINVLPGLKRHQLTSSSVSRLIRQKLSGKWAMCVSANTCMYVCMHACMYAWNPITYNICHCYWKGGHPKRYIFKTYLNI